MMNNASGRKAESRRFLIALAISLALHAAVLWKFGMLPPGLPGTHSGPLQVRLAADFGRWLWLVTLAGDFGR